jgi:hypothetical protein
MKYAIIAIADRNVITRNFFRDRIELIDSFSLYIVFLNNLIEILHNIGLKFKQMSKSLLILIIIKNVS